MILLVGPERFLLPGAGEREVLESQQAHGVVLRPNKGAQMNTVRHKGLDRPSTDWWFIFSFLLSSHCSSLEFSLWSLDSSITVAALICLYLSFCMEMRPGLIHGNGVGKPWESNQWVDLFFSPHVSVDTTIVTRSALFELKPPLTSQNVSLQNGYCDRHVFVAGGGVHQTPMILMKLYEILNAFFEHDCILALCTSMCPDNVITEITWLVTSLYRFGRVKYVRCFGDCTYITL